jgi:hypothetical protein
LSVIWQQCELGLRFTSQKLKKSAQKGSGERRLQDTRTTASYIIQYRMKRTAIELKKGNYSEAHKNHADYRYVMTP